MCRLAPPGAVDGDETEYVMSSTRALASCAAAGLLMTVGIAGNAAADGRPSALTNATFLSTVHQGNLIEIAGGLNAERHGASACVRRVGAVLVRDHRKLDVGVKALAAKLRIALPAAPSLTLRNQLARVEALAGKKSYDGAWLALQAAGHEATLKLIDLQTSTGRTAKVVAAARAARPIVASHLAMVRACQIRALGEAKAVRGAAEGPLSTANVMSATAVTGLAGAGASWAVARRRGGDEAQ
jgi:putative membrane protein